MQDWMTFYIQHYQNEVILSTGRTLKVEYHQLMERLDTDNINALDDKPSQKQALDLKKELFGEIQTEYLPVDLNLEMLKINLGISPSEWEGLDLEEQGRLLASKIISQQIETVERYYSTINRNKRNASQN